MESLQEQAVQAVRWVFSRQHVYTTPEILELACRYRPELSDTLDESGVEVCTAEGMALSLSGVIQVKLVCRNGPLAMC